MTPKIGDDVCYSALMNSACSVRVKVVAVRDRTALVQYADGRIDEVPLTRLSEVPASWNEPQPSICLTGVVKEFAKAGGDVTKLDALKRKRGIR